MQRFGTIWLVTGVLLVLRSATAVPPPVPTTFTYQGQLKDDGVPATGDYDMRFSLYDAPSSGAMVGAPLVFDGASGNPTPISVVQGLFQVELDFGSEFDGTALWLHVDVRPHGVGSYTPLTPRQPLTPVPFALYALDGPGGAGPWTTNGGHIHNTNTGNVGVGTDTAAAKLHVAGDIRCDGPFGIVTHNPNDTRSVAALGWFNNVARIRIGGDGPGAVGGLDIQKTGDRSLMRIYDSGDAWFRGGLDVTGDTWFRSSVGIGTTAPSADLHVMGDGTLTAVRVSNGGGCSMTNTGLIVADICGSARAATFYGVTSNTLVSIANDGAGKAAVFGGDVTFAGGEVGIGTSSPATKLHITGGTDSAPTGGGFLVLGDTTGANISIDNNEIMARTNGVTSPLFLNNNGGDIICGGPIDIGYEIVVDQSAGARANADCPAGKKALGGGCDCISGTEEDFDIIVSRPYQSGDGWHCQCSPVETSVAYALCVNVK